MNNFLKAIALLALSLTLTNCKVEFTADGELIQKEGGATSLTEIRYYNGGWYPAPNQPNFKVDLNLSLLSEGKARLDLQLPECQVSKLVSAREFAKLADALDRAELFVESDNTHIVDAGDEFIETTDDSGESVEIHLRRGDHSSGKWRFQDPSEVRSLLNTLVERYGICASPSSEIVAVEFRRSPNDVAFPMQAETNGQGANLPPGVARESRYMRVDVVGGRQLISGEETTSVGMTRCSRQFNKVESKLDLIAAAEKIQFTENSVVCSMSPSSITVITVIYANGHQQHGYVGCWASRRALNSERFTSDLLKALESVPAKCAY